MATTFLGKPVEGDVSYADKFPAQLSAADYAAILDTLFSFEDVVAVRWEQYAPYFNDGEPCIFNHHGFLVYLKDPSKYGLNPDDSEDEDAYDNDEDPELHGKHAYEAWAFRERHPELHQALKAADEAVRGSGYGSYSPFHSVLLEAFGDHAQVIATRDKFTVEWYEHD